jgi:hypothetical protein
MEKMSLCIFPTVQDHENLRIIITKQLASRHRPNFYRKLTLYSTIAAKQCCGSERVFAINSTVYITMT